MKLPLPRRRVWRVAIYLACFVLIAIAADMLLVEWRRPIQPGYYTTRITGPLMPDGSIDYLTAVEDNFSHGVTRENNAVPLLLQAFGRAALPKNQPEDGITDRLGMAHLPEKGDYFQGTEGFIKSPNDDLITLTDPRLDTDRLRHPSDDVVKWVQANEKPLAIFTEASKRQRFFLPFNGGTRLDTMAAIMLPHVAQMRECSRALIERSLIRLQAGDTAGFRADIVTVLRIARLLGQAPTMVERAVANSYLEVAACHVIRMAAQTGKLSAEDAKQLLADMTRVGELSPICQETINNGERFMILELAQNMSRRGPGGAARLLGSVMSDNTGAMELFRFVPVPYERTMMRLNQFYDGALAALNQPTYPQKAAALKLWNAEIEKIANKNRPLTLLGPDWPILLFIPAITGPDDRWERGRMEDRLTQIVLALSIYHAERHAYPEKLDDLAPAYLPAVPNDLFIEKPLQYSLNGDGYTLYSVGPNMTDDGGKSDKKADDINASTIIVGKGGNGKLDAP